MSIVLGYDESPGARRALNYAIDLAKLLKDDTWCWSTARNRPAGWARSSPSISTRSPKRADRHSPMPSRRPRPPGSPSIVELVDEKPAAALLDAADKHDARLIVVGTYGESPLRGAILGSTPHKLLHWSTRPVLCVPAARGSVGGLTDADRAVPAGRLRVRACCPRRDTRINRRRFGVRGHPCGTMAG